MRRKILSLLNGMSLPIVGSQLRGFKLKVSPLLAFSLFWRNTEPENHYAYKILIRNNDVIFDIGANTGMHSYFFSKHFRNVRIFSFEPLPANFKYIEDMIRLNKLPNIQLVNCALGSHQGETYFNTSLNNSLGFITDKETAIKVKLESLDHFISSGSIKPDFIKIDVEGAESEVLEGFRNKINTVQPVLIIESHSPKNDKAISVFFQQNNYSIFRLSGISDCRNGKPFTCIKNLNSTWPDPEGVWGNIVAIPANRLNSIMQFVKE
jgi:FkbM family methyltransferase